MAFVNIIYLNILRDYFVSSLLFFLNLFLEAVYPLDKEDSIEKAFFDKPNVLMNTV